MTELDEEKLFYERFTALHGDPMLVRIYECFGIGVFRRSSVLEGFNAFIQKTSFGGKRVVEIGTCNGLTALVLSRYFAEVVTVDVEPSAKKHEIAAYLGVKNVRFVDVKDNAQKAALITQLDDFDAAYVDGDHARDTETDFALVAQSGRVMMHEHWPPQPAVIALFNRLRERGTVVTEGKLALWTR